MASTLVLSFGEDQSWRDDHKNGHSSAWFLSPHSRHHHRRTPGKAQSGSVKRQNQTS